LLVRRHAGRSGNMSGTLRAFRTRSRFINGTLAGLTIFTLETNLTKMKLLQLGLCMSLSSAYVLAGPLACATGTVTSYLAASPCAIAGGTVQLTGFSSTFGVSPGVTGVTVFPSGAETFLEIGTGEGLGPLAWNGAGSVSVQLAFNLAPLGPGLEYFLPETGVDGCCIEPGLEAFSTGGLLTTSITLISTGTEPPGEDVMALSVVADWSYTSSSGTVSGIDTNPSHLFYNLESVEITLPIIEPLLPVSTTPEPSSALLMGLGLSGLTTLLVWRESQQKARPSVLRVNALESVFVGESLQSRALRETLALGRRIAP
jgi:PEP-CTERM motif